MDDSELNNFRALLVLPWRADVGRPAVNVTELGLIPLQLGPLERLRSAPDGLVRCSPPGGLVAADLFIVLTSVVASVRRQLSLKKQAHFKQNRFVGQTIK
jgi:hypothetical protein